MKLKEIREEIENMGSVENAAALKKAVPLIVKAYKRIAELTSTARQVKKVVDKLNESASKYAFTHPSVLDGGLLASPLGVMSGDISIDDAIYHFASGFGPVIREDGELLTQEFLLGLPNDWSKSELKLDMTAIMTKYGKGDKLGEALQEKGLVRSVKNQWSVKLNADEVEGCDD